jgi:uncharacterized protein
MINLPSLFPNLDSERLQQLLRTKVLPLLVYLSLGLFLALTVNAVLDLNRVNRLTIAAGLKDGESYQFAQALAKVVADHDPKIRIEVLETPGTSDNLKRLQANEVQLAMAQADIQAPPAAQLVSLLFPDMYQLVAKENSGIQSVPDLRGKRVALPPRNGGQYRSFRFLAEHYGINPDEPRFMTAPDDGKADQAFLNNQVDAVFHVRPAGNQSILNLVQNSQGRIVPIDQAAAMKLKQPTLEATVIPKGAYRGTPPIPDQDQPTVAVWRLLLAHQNVDENTIQQLTNVLYERRQELVSMMSIAANITPPTEMSGTGLPIHPGAQAYYEREKPTFLEANAEVFNLLLSLGVLAFTGFWQLKLRIEQKQKDKADDYIQEVMAMVDAYDFTDEVTRLLYASQLSREELQQLVNSVTERANKTLAEKKAAEVALHKKKISPRSLQSFEFALQVVMDTVTWAIGQMSLSETKNDVIHQTFKQLYQKFEQEEAEKALKGITAIDSSQAFRAKSSAEIRRTLDNILKRAVEALVQERVSQESFQSFRTVWQIAVSDIVNSEVPPAPTSYAAVKLDDR